MPPIDEFLFHTCPHAFTPGIVMAASTGTVHALEDAVFCNALTIGFTGVLRSLVRVDDRSPERRIGMDGIGKRAVTQCGFHVRAH